MTVEQQAVVIRFTVYGQPQSAGSKRSYVPLDKKTKEPFRRPGGGVVVTTVDDNPKSKSWQGAVAFAARQAYKGPLLDGYLSVRFLFLRPRPKGHFKSNGRDLSSKGLAEFRPGTKPDVLKLARGVEDALTGVIWRDDALICHEVLDKDWGEPARVEVEIKALEPPQVASNGGSVSERLPL